MIHKFFSPYIFSINRASWSVQQNLISLGKQLHDIAPQTISSPLFTAFDADQGRAMITGLLTLAAVIEIWLLAIAILTLRRPLFALVVILILSLPGLLSLCGFSIIRPDPHEISFGGPGTIGDVPGYAVLAIMALCGGWSLTILLADFFRLPKERWDLFEHIWIVVGLSAGLFFVADTKKTQDTAEYAETEQAMHGNSAWLMHQTDRYAEWCRNTGNNHLVSCTWATNIHSVLLEDSSEILSLFEEFSPDSLAMWYGSFRRPASPETQAAIKQEIKTYNAAMCPPALSQDGYTVLTSSDKCEIPPASYCSYAFEYGGKDDQDRISRPVALATECVLPTLLTLREKAKHLSATRDENGRQKNMRWGPFYLTLAFLAGIKLSGSTFKALKIEKDKKPDRDWIKTNFVEAVHLLTRKSPPSFGIVVKLFVFVFLFTLTVIFLIKPKFFLRILLSL